MAVNKSRYFKKGSSLCLGTGAFVSGLEYSADCKAEVVGKPSKRFFELGWYQFAKCSTKYYNTFLAASRFTGNVPMEEILMIGDDVRDDVLGLLVHIKSIS